MLRNKTNMFFTRRRLSKSFIFCLTLIVLNSVFVLTGYGAYNAKLTKRVEYINTGLRYVLRNLATIGEFSVILDKSVTGDVSISFEQGVSIKDAVSIVAKTRGYYCQWLSDTATVIISDSKDISENNNRELKVIPLNSAWASSVADALEVVIPKERIKPDIRNNNVEVIANDLEFQNITEIVARLDREKPLIKTEVSIMEVPIEVLGKIITKYSTGKMGVYTLTQEQGQSFSENTAIELLSRQNIIAIDGQEEKAFIGDSIPRIYENNKDGRINYNIEYTNIGTLLNFRSFVDDNNKVTVELKEKVNSFRTSAKIGLSGPKIDSREVDSTVRTDLEQPFLLIGSLQYNEFMQMKNSPYTFPVLNEFYGGGSGKKTGIVILITPCLTSNDLPVTSEGDQQPKTTSTPVNVSNSPTVITTNQAESTPTLSSMEEIPTGEEKPAMEMDLGRISSEKNENTSSRDSQTFDSSAVSDIRYIIRKGDTFEKIVKKFNANVQNIIQRNRLGKTGNMGPGSSLIIPVSNERIYIVKPKETLWRIAKRYGTTVETLKDLNSITDIKKVQTNQKIVLPGLVKRIINPKF